MAARKPVLCVFNASRQSFVTLGITLADTLLSRLRGLLGKMTLRSDEGVWLVPSQGIHTIGLMFPIDVIYLDAQCRVVHLIERLSPFHVAPLLLKSASVLQLSAGSIAISGTQVGDQLLIRSPEELGEYWESERAPSKLPETNPKSANKDA